MIYLCLALSPFPSAIQAKNINNSDKLPIVYLYASCMNFLLWSLYTIEQHLTKIAIVDILGIIYSKSKYNLFVIGTIFFTFYMYVYFHINQQRLLILPVIIMNLIIALLMTQVFPFFVLNISGGVLSYLSQISAIQHIRNCFEQKTQRFINRAILALNGMGNIFMGFLGILLNDWYWIVFPQFIGLFLTLLQALLILKCIYISYLLIS